MGTNVWAEDWSTVWSTDFSSAPSGMTYSCVGSVNISNGYLNYQQNGGSGDRGMTAVFSDSKFNVNTNWKMEFDWNCGSSNTNPSFVSFATNKGTAFTLTWVKYASAVVVTDAAANEISNALPLLGYKQGTCSSWSHFIITGDTDHGIYLTITNGSTTYVDNVLVTSTFGYPATFNGTLGKTVSSMFMDNISFATPKVAGFVASPTGVITAPAGTSRKFTLSCLTDGATIYYSESDIEIGADGWVAYTSEVTTAAETIYAYASDGVNNSEKISFATGAGTTIVLNTPVIVKTAYSDGKYTVKLSSDQNSLAIVPANVTLYYSIDGGSDVEYTTEFQMNAGSSVTAYAVSTGYDNSLQASLTSAIRPALSVEWSIDFAGQATEDKGAVTISDEAFTASNVSFGTISAQGLISNDNFGVKVETSWLLRHNSRGLYSSNGSGTPVGVANLHPNQYIKIVVSEMTTCSVSGAASLVDEMSTPTELYIKVNEEGNACINFNRYIYIKNISVCSEMISATITAAKYATFIPTMKVAVPDGVTAYYVNEIKNNKAQMKEVSVIPANTPVIIYKDDVDSDTEVLFVATADEASNVEGNLLNYSDAETVADGTQYILADGEDGVGFYKAKEGTTIAARKAYLVSPVGANFLSFSFDDETTGIEKVENSAVNANGTMFNLAGQRVAQPTKGLYIVNGKKVVIK